MNLKEWIILFISFLIVFTLILLWSIPLAAFLYFAMLKIQSGIAITVANWAYFTLIAPQILILFVVISEHIKDKRGGK